MYKVLENISFIEFLNMYPKSIHIHVTHVGGINGLHSNILHTSQLLKPLNYIFLNINTTHPKL